MLDRHLAAALILGKPVRNIPLNTAVGSVHLFTEMLQILKMATHIAV